MFTTQELVKFKNIVDKMYHDQVKGRVIALKDNFSCQLELRVDELVQRVELLESKLQRRSDCDCK